MTRRSVFASLAAAVAARLLLPRTAAGRGVRGTDHAPLKALEVRDAASGPGLCLGQRRRRSPSAGGLHPHGPPRQLAGRGSRRRPALVRRGQRDHLDPQRAADDQRAVPGALRRAPGAPAGTRGHGRTRHPRVLLHPGHEPAVRRAGGMRGREEDETPRGDGCRVSASGWRIARMSSEAVWLR